MDNNELIAIFDQQATHYDSQWDKIAPVYLGLFFMMEAVFIIRLKQTYAGKVAILPAIEIAQLIAEAGFSNPVRLFQAGLIQAWFSKRLPG